MTRISSSLVLFLFALCWPVAAQSYVFGGPGSLEGRFQTAGGDMDAQGWIEFYCDGSDHYWQVDSFNAANLNGHGAGNNALWCGQTALQQPAWNNPPGYGNNWWAIAEWKQPVPNPLAAVDVTLQFYYNHDTEPGYDHFLVEWFDGENWNNLLIASGANKNGGVFAAPGLFFDQTWTMQPADFSGVFEDEVRLRLAVQSDGGISDQDSLPLPGGETDGAAQIDDIRVLFDGVEVDGGGDLDGIASFEAGDDEGWSSIGGPCSCQLMAQLPTEFEPTMSNTTPVIGHVQHEAIRSSNFCTFGSPAFDWAVPGSPTEATLQFDAFFSSDTRIGFSDYDVNMSWVVDGAWSPITTVYTGDTPSASWETVQVDLSGIVPANATQAWVAFQVYAGDGLLHAMAYDNVMLWRGDASTATDGAPALTGPLRIHPNPSNPKANIAFRVGTAGRTRLLLFNQKGRLLGTLFDEYRESGEHQFSFDGRDAHGQTLSSGVYFLQLTTANGVRGRRFTLLK